LPHRPARQSLPLRFWSSTVSPARLRLSPLLPVPPAQPKPSSIVSGEEA
jgi:hypothetical protein